MFPTSYCTIKLKLLDLYVIESISSNQDQWWLTWELCSPLEAGRSMWWPVSDGLSGLPTKWRIRCPGGARWAQVKSAGCYGTPCIVQRRICCPGGAGVQGAGGGHAGAVEVGAVLLSWTLSLLCTWSKGSNQIMLGSKVPSWYLMKSGWVRTFE